MLPAAAQPHSHDQIPHFTDISSAPPLPTTTRDMGADHKNIFGHLCKK